MGGLSGLSSAIRTAAGHYHRGRGRNTGTQRKRGHVPQSGERGNTHEHEKTGGKKGIYLGKSPWGGVGPEVIVSEGKGCLQAKRWLSPRAPR